MDMKAGLRSIHLRRANEVEANEAVSEEGMGARVPVPVEIWRYSLMYVE